MRFIALSLLLATPALAQPVWPAKAQLEVRYGAATSAQAKPQSATLRWPAARGAAGYAVIRDGKVLTELPVHARTHTVAVERTARYAVRAKDEAGRKGPALGAKVRKQSPRRRTKKKALVLATLGTSAGSGGSVADVLSPGGLGSGGLGLSGLGVGTSGPRDGVGLGTLGTAGRPRSVVRLGQLEVTGPLPAKVVRRILRRVKPPLRRCGRGKFSEPAQFTAHVTVQAGRVVAAQVGGPEAHDAVSRCVSKILKRVRFPKAAASTQITQPITVEPGG